MSNKILLSPVKCLYDLIVFRLIPERMFLKLMFRKKLGYKLDLENPKTYNEKIQWLKLNDRTPLHTICADKYAVREYIKEKIGEEYLIPLIMRTENVNDICPENLPDYPVIIKTNHDSGTYFIIKDKTEQNWDCVRKQLRKALNRNYYYRFKEWQYKNIEPCIIVEKLLVDSFGNIPKDYKFLCIKNVIKFIHVDCKQDNMHYRNNYFINWELSSLKFPAEFSNFPKELKPKQYLKMLGLVKTLSNEFICSRIDFYLVDDEIFFGEITFHPTSGFGKFEPKEWDYKLGKMLNLNI